MHIIVCGSEKVDNPILKALKDRRTIYRFEKTPIDEKKIDSILEAGRWAPSWLNKQPWRFVVITDQDIKESVSERVPTVHSLGIKEAPICFAVCVDPEEDPYHFIEDGAAATQNMALAAHSLGLGSCWIGVFNLKKEKGSSEERVKEIIQIPKKYRVISLLPVGIPKHIPEKTRKELAQLVTHRGLNTSAKAKSRS